MIFFLKEENYDFAFASLLLLQETSKDTKRHSPSLQFEHDFRSFRRTWSSISLAPQISTPCLGCCNEIYLFLWSWAGGILRILQSDWFRERAVFSYLLTAVMVTNYAKRRVKLRIETLKWLLLHFAKFVDFWKRNFTQRKNIPDQFILLYICWHVDETMCKIKTWLFQFFLIVSPTF